jgi:UDP-N-acetylmuramoyl-tripeptide--D-alanyl-D-alanine ligase
VSNLLAALAVAQVFEIEPGRLHDAVRTFAMGNMRGEKLDIRGVTVWNDCYNSNPEAAESMVDVLVAAPAAHHIAVLGEMLELGHAAEPLHRRVGRYAAERGVDVVIGVRGSARWTVDEARAAGARAEFFDNPADAGEFVRDMAREGDAVLFKGSRGVRVEQAVERFVA